MPRDTPADDTASAPVTPAAQESDNPVEPAAPQPDLTPLAASAPDAASEQRDGIEAPVPAADPTEAVETVEPTVTATPGPLAPTPAVTKAIPSQPAVRLSPEQAAVAGAGAAAAAVTAAALVVR